MSSVDSRVQPLTVRSIKNVLKHEMGIESRLDEAFVAQAKQFENTSTAITDAIHGGHIELYKQYVKAFNEVSAELDTVDRDDIGAARSRFGSLKRDEAHILNSIYLHELFFANIGDRNSMLHTDALPYIRLSRDFGEFDRWSDDFIACALSAREGWAVCYFNIFLKRYVNAMIDGHAAGVPLGCVPLIVVDMWTHSRIDFGNDASAYVRAVMAELNWRTIENRFTRAERIVDALK